MKLNRNRRAEIIAQLLSGTAKFLGVGRVPTRTKWLCEYGDNTFAVVFDERLREIVTVHNANKER